MRRLTRPEALGSVRREKCIAWREAVLEDGGAWGSVHGATAACNLQNPNGLTKSESHPLGPISNNCRVESPCVTRNIVRPSPGEVRILPVLNLPH